MGWNDHVETVQTECKNCGAIDMWEMWDEVAKQRYAGEIGKFLGHDIGNHGTCPNCGSSNGVPNDDDMDYS